MGGLVFRSDWPLRKQLIVSFSGLAVLALTIVIIVGVVNVFELGSSTEDTATTALESQIRANMQLTADETGRVIGQKMNIIAQTAVKNIAAQMKLSHKEDTAYPFKQQSPHSDSIWAFADYANDQKTFEKDGVTNINGLPTGLVSCDGTNTCTDLAADPHVAAADRQFTVSTKASSFYVRGVEKNSWSNFALDTLARGSSSDRDVFKLARQSAFLDKWFIQMFDANPSIVQMYIGLNSQAEVQTDDLTTTCETDPCCVSQSTACSRVDASDSYGTVRYLEEQGSSSQSVSSLRLYPGQTSIHSYQLDGTNIAYDATQRGWYRDALRDSSGDAIFTNPYKDAFNKGWMITVAQAVRDTSTMTQYSEVGVVGVDILLSDLADEITASSDTLNNFKSAYVALFKATTYDGGSSVVQHPCWDRDSWASDAPPSINDLEKWDEGVWEKFRTQSSGVIELETNACDRSGTYFVSWAHALNSNTDMGAITSSNFKPYWVVMVAVPRSEAIEPVVELSDKVKSTETTVAVTVIMVSLATGVLTLILVWWTANKLSRPLTVMTRVATDITNSAADKEEQSRNTAKNLNKLDSIKRNDELGELVTSFSAMIRGMDQDAKKKRDAPKYPSNPYWGKRDLPWGSIPDFGSKPPNFDQ